MSKVKYLPDDFHKTKENARHSLRRKESEYVKNKRMQIAKQHKYMYRYVVKDARVVKEKVVQTVLEHVENTYHWETVTNWVTLENGRSYPQREYKRVIDGQKVVPAHTVIRTVKVGEEPVKPHLKESKTDRKKWLKRQAAKKVRRADAEDIGSFGNYKKLYDIAWELW